MRFLKRRTGPHTARVVAIQTGREHARDDSHRTKHGDSSEATDNGSSGGR